MDRASDERATCSDDIDGQRDEVDETSGGHRRVRTGRGAGKADHSRGTDRTDLLCAVRDSSDVCFGGDPDDGVAGRGDDYDFADWGSDLSATGGAGDAGVGRVVDAGCEAACFDSAAVVSRRFLSYAAQQGARQARGASATVDAEFGAGEDANVESCVAKAVIRFVIFFESEQAFAT